MAAGVLPVSVSLSVYNEDAGGSGPKVAFQNLIVSFGYRVGQTYIQGFLGQFQVMSLVPGSLFIVPSFTLKSVLVRTLNDKITLFMGEGRCM